MTKNTTIDVPPAAPSCIRGPAEVFGFTTAVFSSCQKEMEEHGPMIAFLTLRATPMVSAGLKILRERTREDDAKIRVVTTKK